MDTLAEDQGGGKHGGPRRWTGKGPRPARHIPWPELFKHHQSVLTGHLKMMDMVRKHCVEGSGNHATAQACVDRTHEMLRMFNKATSTFVPPKDNLEKVPLGASSASMYPGYSPADHIYGEAASEFGKHLAELKKQGIDFPQDPDGPEYNTTAAKKRAQQEIEEKQKMKQSNNKPNGARPMEGAEEADIGQLFVVDSNPTPVPAFVANVTTSLTKSKNKANDKAKRRNSNEDDAVEVSEAPKKKAKVSVTPTEATNDDFEAEAEAKHKEKEAKRKAKKEKKRKRDSEPVEIVDVQVNSPKLEMPKKKKAKKDRGDDDAAVEATKRKEISDDVPDDVPDADNEKKKRKKKKKDRDAV